MRYAYAVAGSTWAPRVRARAVVSRLPGGVVVGSGEPCPPDAHLPSRRVRWTDPTCLEGFDLVVGDWSAVAMRPRGVPGVAVMIAEQQQIARYGQGNPPDDVWDCETRPLHPWATEPLPSRREAQDVFGEDRRPVLGVLDQSHTPGVLWRICREWADPGWHVFPLAGWGADRFCVGADLLVSSAGWAQVTQAKAARIPHIAVDQVSDQWPRAHCTLAELATVIANIEPAYALLPGHHRPYLEDHLPAFAEFCGITNPQPLVEVHSGL